MPNAEQRAMVRRRAVLAAALGGSVAGLTGCGIRLESDAPHIPGVKKQGPPADQAVLRKVLHAVTGGATVAAAESSTWAKRLAKIHRAQRDRLTKVMATQGMTPSPAPTDDGSGGTSDTSLAPLDLFEHGAAGEMKLLAGLSTRNLPMAAAIVVTHAAAAQILGAPNNPSGATVPKAAVAQAILPSLRAATYAFEVIVAKTPLDARKKAEATLTVLRATRATWEASLGKDVPTSPDGFTLPVQPTSDARRNQLAQRVLTDLVSACAGQVTATRGDRGAFVGLTTLWADATAQLWEWGAKPTPFPGLTS